MDTWFSTSPQHGSSFEERLANLESVVGSLTAGVDSLTARVDKQFGDLISRTRERSAEKPTLFSTRPQSSSPGALVLETADGLLLRIKRHMKEMRVELEAEITSKEQFHMQLHSTVVDHVQLVQGEIDAVRADIGRFMKAQSQQVADLASHCKKLQVGVNSNTESTHNLTSSITTRQKLLAISSCLCAINMASMPPFERKRVLKELEAKETELSMLSTAETKGKGQGDLRMAYSDCGLIVRGDREAVVHSI